MKGRGRFDKLSCGHMRGYYWCTAANEMGFRTGYIRVNRHHPWFLLDYYSPMISALDVHGGITWADKGHPGHVPAFSYQWWLGFDCAHLFDVLDVELMSTKYRAYWEATPDYRECFGRGVVRDLDFVEAQCHLLCRQALAAQGFAHQLAGGSSTGLVLA